MNAFLLTIDQTNRIMVIPDADAHMDGHPVLTYSYTLYKWDAGQPNLQAIDTDRLMSSEKIRDPNYLGTIYFDQPYKAFTYTSDGMNELSGDEVEELIRKISEYRKNPNRWVI